MSATLWHEVVEAGRFYKSTKREQPIAEHMLYDKRRSKETNARAFRRYLALLRGMHTERCDNTLAMLEYEGEACLVCSHESAVMRNIFHRKSGSLFNLGSTPLHNTARIFVHVDCYSSPKKVMMCGNCNEKWDTREFGERSLDSTQAETILRRLWKQDSYPSVYSVLRVAA